MTVEDTNTKSFTFQDNHTLTAIHWKGRWCWIVGQVGKALGYTKSGEGLGISINRNWREEFITGTDVDVIKGSDLRELREVTSKSLVTSKATAGLVGSSEKVTTNPVVTSEPPLFSAFASSVMVLYETGLHMVLLKTDMPIGKKLRRWLVTEVLPQLMRTGEYKREPDAIEPPDVKVEVHLPDFVHERLRAAAFQSRMDIDVAIKYILTAWSLTDQVTVNRGEVAFQLLKERVVKKS